MLSCEPCRRKKCKCDRKLPHCSPCIAHPTNCLYTASNKRGLPNGYLNKLEQRLAETELALYETLVEFSQHSNSQVSTLSSAAEPSAANVRGPLANKSKTMRMHEWESYPLQQRWQREQWRSAKSQEFSTILGGSTSTPQANGQPRRRDTVAGETDPSSMECGTNYEQNNILNAGTAGPERQNSTPSTSSGMHQRSISRGQDIQGLSAGPACESPNTFTPSMAIAVDPTEPVASSDPEPRIQSEHTHIYPVLETRGGGNTDTLDLAEQLLASKWQTYF